MEIDNKELEKVTGGFNECWRFKCPFCKEKISASINTAITKTGMTCPFCKTYLTFDQVHKSKE